MPYFKRTLIKLIEKFINIYNTKSFFYQTNQLIYFFCQSWRSLTRETNPSRVRQHRIREVMQWPQWISDVGRPIIKIDRFLSARISFDPRLPFPRPPLVDGIMHALGSDYGSSPRRSIDHCDCSKEACHGGELILQTPVPIMCTKDHHESDARFTIHSSPSGFWSMHHMPISHWASTWTKYRSRRGERLSFIKRQHMAGPTGEEPPSYSYHVFLSLLSCPRTYC